MVRIRLRRVGAKKQPSYRIVVTDGKSPRDGRFIEKIGFYNPRTQPALMEINEMRALYWLSHGAQPSDAVRRMLDQLGTLGRYQRLRSGENLEALAAEASGDQAQIDRRTRRDDIKPVSKKKELARAAAAAEGTTAVDEAETVEEPAAIEEPAPVDEVAESDEAVAVEEPPTEGS